MAVPLLVFLYDAAAPGEVAGPFVRLLLARGRESPVVRRARYRQGLGTLAVGGLAAALAFGVGLLLKQVAGRID